jgi:hemerythrin superfamily protein
MIQNAIAMLKAQHREIEDLFRKIESADPPETQERLLLIVANALTVHAAIEEAYFYPALQAGRTEDILVESLAEHQEMKRLTAGLLGLGCTDETFQAKVVTFIDKVEHHMREEEKVIFAKAKRILGRVELDEVAIRMQRRMDEIFLKSVRVRHGAPDRGPRSIGLSRTSHVEHHPS